MNIYKVLDSIAYIEDEETQALFDNLSHIKKKGFLTKKELLLILKWKSPRPLQHYNLNSEKEVKEVTSLAFSIKNDCLKLHLLTALKGVNYPSASAILMFFDPKRFPVLDIRVWKQLYKMKLVNSNSRGQNFTLGQCDAYLSTIRSLAKEVKQSARQVEKRLFDYDRKKQVGTLYKLKTGKRNRSMLV